MIYTSRSRIETFQECPRRGYINFLWDGRGLAKRAASVYLSTGSYTHIGLEFLCNVVKIGNNQIPTNWNECIDRGVGNALVAYQDEISRRGFDLEDGEDFKNNQYVIQEQCALVEAFIRTFGLRVLPDLLSRFRIVDVEKEEVVIVGELCIQARIDVILEEISTSDLYVVSFKTAANWDKRQEKANEHDNQGLSETWVLENRLHEENQAIENVVVKLGLDKHLYQHPKIDEATRKYLNYINKFKKNEKVMGVIMIYFMKGKRYESYSNPGRWEQHSPLIRGYRKLVGTDYEYASSLYYDNPNNKSGKGKLGKGWESFLVWEDEQVGGVKGWINMLIEGRVGGDDVIGQNIKIPAPYFRNQEHMESWVRQTISKEEVIERNNRLVSGWDNKQDMKVYLDKTFDQTRKHCHYPTDCSYLDICYNQAIFDDPVGSGKYVYRMPHHKEEEKEHERLYQISNNSNEQGEREQKGAQMVKKIYEEINEEIVDDMEIIVE